MLVKRFHGGLVLSLLLLAGCGGGSDTASPPSLLSAPAQLYTQGEKISPYRFKNNGGGGLTFCVVSPALPDGLSLAISADRNSCEISGTPVTFQDLTNYVVTASNGAGKDAASVRISIVASAIAPSLQTPAAQNYIQFASIAPLLLTNAGGGQLTACKADPLPDGLAIAISADGSSCEVSGTPTTVQAAADVTITATNPVGSSRVVVPMAVAVGLPSLQDPAAQRYGQNQPVTPLALVNTGGTALTGCQADTLPAGLTVAVTSDGSSCEISGTPTAAQAATVHTITASNATGSASAQVSIRVDEAVTLVLQAAATRQFQFSWNVTSDVNHYNLLENPDGTSGFSVVDTLAAGSGSTTLTVPLHRRTAAQYLLQTCFSINDSDCDDSNTVTVSGTLADAAGFFKASNTEAGDKFGEVVAISADGSTLAISAPQEDSGAIGIDGSEADNLAPDAGAVYVFVQSNGLWSKQAYIKASNTGAGDLFGSRLGLSDDGNLLVVAAPQEDSSATGIGGNEADNAAAASGAVYVFSRLAGVWSQQAYIKAGNTGAGDNFGSSVAISGDGFTLAVGAELEDSDASGIDGADNDNLSGSGAVYVFVRNGTSWVQQAYVKASNPDGFDKFGAAVSLDRSGDTLTVGAPQEDSKSTVINVDLADNQRTDAGAAYVFTRNAGVWSQQAYIKATNSGADDRFGAAVSLSNDGNLLAVGAFQEDSASTGVNGEQLDDSATDAGAVYVYVRINDNWFWQAYLKADNTDAGDRFGQAVALSGDGSALVVGAPQEDSNATGVGGDSADNSLADSGALYVFTVDASGWQQQAFVKAGAADTLDFFGQSVDLIDDGNALAAGTPADDSQATGVNGDRADNNVQNSGAAYLY